MSHLGAPDGDKDADSSSDVVVEEIEEDDAIMEKVESAATDNKQKTTFICVVEDDSQTSGEPKYVWVDGKLTMNSQEDASADKNYKCKVIKNGYKKMNKIRKR